VEMRKARLQKSHNISFKTFFFKSSTSFNMSTGALSPRVKRLGSEGDY
jgi:hypothetical protein